MKNEPGDRRTRPIAELPINRKPRSMADTFDFISMMASRLPDYRPFEGEYKDGKMPSASRCGAILAEAESRFRLMITDDPQRGNSFFSFLNKQADKVGVKTSIPSGNTRRDVWIIRLGSDELSDLSLVLVISKGLELGLRPGYVELSVVRITKAMDGDGSGGKKPVERTSFQRQHDWVSPLIFYWLKQFSDPETITRFIFSRLTCRDSSAPATA